MKKFVFTTMLVSLLFTSALLAVEQCNEWFQKNDFGIVGTMGESGTGVVLDQNGELSKIFASGTARYDFNDGDEVSEALSEANMLAKSNLAKFLKEDIASKENIDKISSKKKTLLTDGNMTDTMTIKSTTKTQTMTLSNSANALLAGVIKVCESHDATKKKIQVVLAVSPKTAAAATKAANMFNKEIGSRKSAEEYAVERKNTDSNNKLTPTNNAGSQPADSSYSNTAKNMNF